MKATDEKAAEAGADAGEFTISRDGDTTAALTVQFTLSGTAVNGTDYKTLATSATIAAGAASTTVKVEPMDDAAVESPETVMFTLKEDAAYTIGTANTATVTIEDNESAPPAAPAVIVKASDEKAAEAGTDAGEFTISRDWDTTAALTVQFTLSGTAVNGTDYKTLATSATIAAGAASTAVKVEPMDDAAVEGHETVILALKEDAAYTIGTANTATVTIEDNDAAPPGTPIVIVKASDEKAAETGADAGEFTISRDGDTTAALTVQFTLSGTAVNGTDYKTLATSATIAAGANSATVKVEPTDDAAVEGHETVILTLKEDVAYSIGKPNTANVTIEDNDAEPQPSSPPTVSITVSIALISEEASGEARFTLTRTGGTTAALTVRLALGGTAANGVDYKLLSDSVTIPAGASSAAITCAPVNDGLVELPETVILTIKPDSTYQIGGLNLATLVIADDDLGLDLDLDLGLP
ncbi:MAG: hypothetical protein HYY23_01965 [Verrucomicrobia bacterium]|nr:hypothetical protein [Verrucomicrobiota bacterium]